MGQSNVIVSVLMCVHNGEKYIEDALKSVLNQTYKDIELIIINDASNDKTKSIIFSLLNNTNFIYHENKNNLGLTKSLNIGIDFASGKWIARIDCDDIWKKDKLQKQILVAKGDISVIGSNYEVIDHHGNNIKNYNVSKFIPQKLRMILMIPFIPHSSVLINSTFLNICNGYNNKYDKAQDLELWLRISKYGKIISVNDNLVKIRKHNHQISVVNKYEQCQRAKSAIYEYIINYNSKIKLKHNDICNYNYIQHIMWIIKLLLVKCIRY